MNDIKPYYDKDGITIYNNDCLLAMKEITDNSVDAVITDPPYELGFMGKKWDNSGIAFNVNVWKEALRVLKPGGYLLSFGGSRTHHRIMVAIEDAGFEIRDTICWAFGSGFPKSHNIALAIDKKRGVIGNRGQAINMSGKGERKDIKTAVSKKNGTLKDGYRSNNEYEGWGTALKPAVEFICMARKSLSEKSVALNCLKWGTGGINIDESRVDFKSKQDKNKHIKGANSNRKAGLGAFQKSKKLIPDTEHIANGRFPANLIHDNSEEVRECFSDTVGAGNVRPMKQTKITSIFLGKNNADGTNPNKYNNKGGSTSRFFKSIIYQSKASRKERNKGCEGLEYKLGGSLEGGDDKRINKPQLKLTKNNHPTVKPLKLMKYLINMVSREDMVILDPFLGSGTTAIACQNLKRKFIGIEISEDYCKIARERLKVIQKPLF